MSELTIGVIGTSRKTDERRYPIHPAHLMRIPEKLRKKMIFEQGYGAAFNMSDEEIAALTGGIATRSDILTQLGTVIIAKPVLADLQELKEGGTIWGYVHCVQQQAITQAALDRKLTLIAFEDMFVWSPQGNVGRHTFYKNNEMAGYCAVLHALQLKGIDGHYGNQRKTIIFSFGAVSRGAIYALKAHGFRDITICIQRPDHEVREEVLDCHYVKVRPGIEGEARMMVVEHDGSQRPLTELISEADIIVNGTYQETANPVNFVIESEADCLKPNSLIIDVSCDEGMGFFFAKPTTFKHPMFSYKTTDYYAVDHTPSYLWESATRSISAALIVYLPTVLAGPEQWQKDETIRRAINIEHGIIKNNAILAFQNRESAPPYHLQIADIT
ncbi:MULTISPECIES: N(5)-(carboxyethyl)ornithine synthase [Pseudoalteromonas]|jgi:alanine dehydrogenase|uniref:NAD(P) transhydrogenase subunit alpha n=1 Tax=Pseudoalteromonas tetraodonis TaxID=43659 RepID=A0ABD4ES74_9GAMM|nr:MULTISPECIES: N(5)-(carboxyethyl)ornithine synthase [Pseudoalteromonas]MAY59770.1 NAD(P) transhydrogenase subunit alpha [Pseudoalteromonas sp.]KYL36293.1 NAD(P) transhydrogenase subunit alpha [Pseudoalteromonas spiralis]MDN3404426.1 N(5)-(carboxyethyl)ornithine synthase [Pseudoalteromonas sp. APC 3218]MDN3408329.1 N(5)-(carboxyethyl)ornithine synthase [Pseudoalteromonas sp. APC 3894]MDN3415969.1 N(5)-(carboxyethyl)ornithine synthase [Pseudoalteromonas sp. APC 3227]|tara:strand:+ start:869 stop:2026 length:1158 start_codon:yes stop_codon:yes gene_type:complete